MARRSAFLPMFLVALAAFGLGFLSGRFIATPSQPEPETRGSIVLAWVPPERNVDESPLTDLAGFVIRCWNQAGLLSVTRYVNDPAADTYELDGLEPGIYNCGVSAFNEEGVESSLSNMVPKIVASR